jgi:hyaluronoglucosaminidase
VTSPLYHLAAVALLLASGALPADAMAPPPLVASMPALFPTPQDAHLTAAAPLPLAGPATLVQIAPRDSEVQAGLLTALADLGIEKPRAASHPPRLTRGPLVLAGLAGAPAIRAALGRLGAEVPARAEGYAIASGLLDTQTVIVIAGRDDDGLYHAVQSFRQIARRGYLPAITIRDYPAMPVRGTIEGFYGKPWSTADRVAHMRFLGAVNANAYVYSPKDDAFARDRWREPYPREIMSELKTPIDEARRQHVRFTYAISPGPSICYSDPADVAAIKRKFAAFAALGVRSFYIAFDDIEYTKWNCDRDSAALGPPGAQAAGTAQAALATGIYRWLQARSGGKASLMVVPTEYYDAKPSPYKTALAAGLDPAIALQWTGTDVVPPAISIGDTRAATKAFGRKTVLWDNYPTNDYSQSTGRLLMAPYGRRQAGLASELGGILANPMNQEAASRIGIFGSASFAWNDLAYDPDAALRAAAAMLAGYDRATQAALLLFLDTQHLAPTFGDQPWQEQSPALRAELDHARDAIANGTPEERHAAIADLAHLADRIASAPAQIRSGVTDAGFLAQAEPWLDALALWGTALRESAAGLAAADRGDRQASVHFTAAASLAERAASAHTIPGATRPQGPLRIADGVLDLFIREAPGLIGR